MPIGVRDDGVEIGVFVGRPAPIVGVSDVPNSVGKGVSVFGIGVAVRVAASN
jgi:hypothetical protein